MYMTYKYIIMSYLFFKYKNYIIYKYKNYINVFPLVIWSANIFAVPYELTSNEFTFMFKEETLVAAASFNSPI